MTLIAKLDEGVWRIKATWKYRHTEGVPDNALIKRVVDKHSGPHEGKWTVMEDGTIKRTFGELMPGMPRGVIDIVELSLTFFIYTPWYYSPNNG